jgi:hypothetical protein
MDANFTIFFKQGRAWPHNENAELGVFNENSDDCYLIIFQTGFHMGDPGHITNSKPTLNSNCSCVQFLTLVVMGTNGVHTENVFT